MEQKKDEKKCDICKNNATTICYDCSFYLCNSCFEFIHQKNRNLGLRIKKCPGSVLVQDTSTEIFNKNIRKMKFFKYNFVHGHVLDKKKQ